MLCRPDVCVECTLSKPHHCASMQAMWLLRPVSPQPTLQTGSQQAAVLLPICTHLRKAVWSQWQTGLWQCQSSSLSPPCLQESQAAGSTPHLPRSLVRRSACPPPFLLPPWPEGRCCQAAMEVLSFVFAAELMSLLSCLLAAELMSLLSCTASLA